MRPSGRARCAACCRCGSASASTCAVLLAGNRLLIDPDTMWQITVGQWIIDHRAVPETDVYSFTMRGQPWISTQWLAQVLYAKAYAIAGWSGPVVLAAGAIAATFALLARFLNRRLSESTTLVFVAAALALTVPHLLARPHVLAMPVMVVWVGGLIAAADRRGAPSFWLLPLMALWANLHGGFVFGLVLIAPIALDAVIGADATERESRWCCAGRCSASGAGCGLLHALWLECAAGVAKDSGARQRAAADHGMAADRIRRPRRVRDLSACSASGLRCFAASSCRRCGSCCCSACCIWRSHRGAPWKSWRCWRRWCWRRRWRGRSAAVKHRPPTLRRRRAACCSPASRWRWWRER